MSDVPKAGRYRLFRWARPRTYAVAKGDALPQRLQCRACFRYVKVESQWAHRDTELRRHGGEAGLALFLRLRSVSRRSKRNLRRARYEYAVGRGADRR